MKKLYIYNSVEDYEHHLRKLKSQNKWFSSDTSIKKAIEYYFDEYEFCLYVEDDIGYQVLTYGNVSEDTRYPEPIIYMRKNTNINSY